MDNTENLDLTYGSKDFNPPSYLDVPKFEDEPIVYISGPMTGHLGFNYEEFERVSNALTERGYRVVCPTQPELLKGIYTPDFYYRNGIQMLLRCNAIYLLNGWEASRGAQLELAVANALGFEVLNTHIGDNI